jgi:hypothetical protein
MTVGSLIEALGLRAFALPDGARELGGGYTGDLLSWVMGRAKEGCAWVTIMSNPNIVAVAHLCNAACVVLAEGVAPDEGVAESALGRGVNLLGSELAAFELSAKIQALL